MSYDICKKCERFFKRDGNLYCSKCNDEQDSSRETINEYLELNPGASILEIVRETGIKLKDVNMFLESGGAFITDSYSGKKFLNLREEELQKEQEVVFKKESIKITNKFRSRRLREQ